MVGFTFYRSFYDTIKRIKKPTDQQKCIMAVVEYMRVCICAVRRRKRLHWNWDIRRNIFGSL